MDSTCENKGVFSGYMKHAKHEKVAVDHAHYAKHTKNDTLNTDTMPTENDILSTIPVDETTYGRVIRPWADLDDPPSLKIDATSTRHLGSTFSGPGVTSVTPSIILVDKDTWDTERDALTTRVSELEDTIAQLRVLLLKHGII